MQDFKEIIQNDMDAIYDDLATYSVATDLLTRAQTLSNIMYWAQKINTSALHERTDIYKQAQEKIYSVINPPTP